VAAGRLPYLSRRRAFGRPSSENGGDGAALSPPSPKPLRKPPTGRRERLSRPQGNSFVMRRAIETAG
jgi:hypothetical protein